MLKGKPGQAVKPEACAPTSFNVHSLQAMYIDIYASLYTSIYICGCVIRVCPTKGERELTTSEAVHAHTCMYEISHVYTSLVLYKRFL